MIDPYPMGNYPQHIYEAYDEMLDEEGIVEFCGTSAHPSALLKVFDPILYEVGLSDWLAHLESEGRYDPVGEDFCDWDDDLPITTEDRVERVLAVLGMTYTPDDDANYFAEMNHFHSQMLSHIRDILEGKA